MSIALGIPEGALAVLRNTMAEEALVSEKITQHPRTDLRLKRHRRIRGLASPFRANVAEYLHELWIEERN